MSSPREHLIVALDVPTAAKAKHLVQGVGDSAGYFKIGKQLFTAEGPNLVRELVAAGHKIFLDLKFYDIPTTVAGAVTSAASLGASMITVHASGGSKMLQAAVQAAAAAPNRPMILAVTVLTSLRDEDLQELGIAGRAQDQVLRLASLARAAGCGAVVASPLEARLLRAELGTGFAIVTPGIRPARTAKADQARAATPAEALSAGATHIVVGRPIIEAADPGAAARAILQEIESLQVAT